MTILADRRAAIVARARELDDIYPDHICPGCGADIIGWGGHDGHVAGIGPARWTVERGCVVRRDPVDEVARQRARRDHPARSGRAG